MSAPFSLVIPAHDRERYVAAAVRSVLAQTRDDFELVVWDAAPPTAPWLPPALRRGTTCAFASSPASTSVTSTGRCTATASTTTPIGSPGA